MGVRAQLHRPRPRRQASVTMSTKQTSTRHSWTCRRVYSNLPSPQKQGQGRSRGRAASGSNVNASAHADAHCYGRPEQVQGVRLLPHQAAAQRERLGSTAPATLKFPQHEKNPNPGPQVASATASDAPTVNALRNTHEHDAYGAKMSNKEVPRRTKWRRNGTTVSASANGANATNHSSFLSNARATM